MQNSQIPNRIVQPWAQSSTNIATVPVSPVSPSRASWNLGFQDSAFQPYTAGGTPIAGIDMQGCLNEISAGVRWLTAGAQFPWDSTFESDSHVGGYPKGSLVGSSDYSTQWRSTAENNTTNPETGTGSSIPTWLPPNASVLSLTVSNVNITLTPLQANVSAIDISGTLSANIQITLPAFPGMRWTVNNKIIDANNNYVITFVGSGVTTSKGNCAMMLCNGVIGSSFELVCDSTGSLLFAEADTPQYASTVAVLRNAIPPSPHVYSRKIKLLGYYAPHDAGGGLEYLMQYGHTVGYYSDNGGTVIVPTGGDGSYAWVAVPGQNVTALHFGADPTFTSDSTSAIQSYWSWCATQAVTHGGLAGSTNGYTGFIPPGRYKIASYLQIQPGVVLAGNGWGTSPIESARYNPPTGTTLEFTGSATVGIDGSIGTNPVTGVGLQDMILKNSGSVATGVHLAYATELGFIKRCFIWGFTSIGLNVDNSSDLEIHGNIFYNNGGNGLKLGSNTNNIDVDFNQFNSTGSVSLYVSAANAITIGDNNSFYGLPSDGSSIYVDGNSTDVAVKTPMWDFSGGISGHPVTFLNVQSGTNITLEGLRKKSGASTTYAQAVNFTSSAVSCAAKLGVFGNFPAGVNNSTSSRITYNAAYEPGIYALCNATQVIAASTPTVVNFATDVYDPKNEWTSGNIFSPNDQGFYNLTLALYAQNTASGSSNDVTVSVTFKDITANTTVFSQTGIGISNNNSANIGFSGAFQATPGHQYQVIVSYTTAASGALSILINSGQGLGATQIRLHRFA